VRSPESRHIALGVQIISPTGIHKRKVAANYGSQALACGEVRAQWRSALHPGVSSHFTNHEREIGLSAYQTTFPMYFNGLRTNLGIISLFVSEHGVLEEEYRGKQAGGVGANRSCGHGASPFV